MELNCNRYVHRLQIIEENSNAIYVLLACVLLSDVISVFEREKTIFSQNSRSKVIKNHK